MPYTYDYPRPCVTVDCIIFRGNGPPEVLLVRRKNPPFQGKWAFPGGFVDMDETLEESAHRELKEETGLGGLTLHQLHAFSDPDRDPRGRVITVAFYGIAGKDHGGVKGSDDAEEANWFRLDDIPPLAFDHEVILRKALEETGIG